MRKPIIAGNWKMNKTKAEALAFVEAVANEIPSTDVVDAAVCVPTIYLDAMMTATAGTNLKIGAQNMHQKDAGAFTAETSPLMLVDLKVPYVVLGHSERRQYFGETDTTVNEKTLAAFAHGLTPIVCVGEYLEERENGTTNAVVEKQTLAALFGLTAEQVAQTVIAYEPVWAIGTGKVATNEQANETCGYIRQVIARVYGNEAAQAVRIQYGGSVTPDTIGALMSESDIDGALVGGASLVADSFLALLNGVK